MANTHILNSHSYDGRYLQVSLTQSIDTANNRSLISGTVTSLAGAVTWYATGATTINIGGVQRYYRARESNGSGQSSRGFVGYIDAFYVSHDGNGNLSLGVEIVTAIYAAATQSRSNTWTLNSIDRSEPSVSFSYGNVTVNSVYITANASTTCDTWQYSLNGGSSWTTFDSGSGTSKSYTITGLSANTGYSLRVRARKTSNSVYGTSGTQGITTLGTSIINSVDTVTADNATVNIVFNRTIYSSSFSHTLRVKNGSTVILSLTGLTGAAGTASQTVTLTAEQKATLLSAMSIIKSFTGTFELITYSGSTQVGSATTKTATVQTTSANSAPTFSNSDGFIFNDTNTAIVAITGNNQVMIKGYSTLYVSAYAATAKNGATISSYEVTAAGTVKSSAGTAISVGTLPESGSKTITLKVTDSRGYTVTKSKAVTVADYTPIDITNFSLRRINEVEDYTELSVSGMLSAITISGSNKNAFQSMQYRYKLTSAPSYGSWYTMAATATSSNFSFNSGEWVNFNADNSWNIQIRATDKLTNEIVDITLPQGTPLVTFRSKKLGINNRNPQVALDVVGEIKQNGTYIMGYIGKIENDFNDYKTGGIYDYIDIGASNAPGTAGILEVVSTPSENKVYENINDSSNNALLDNNGNVIEGAIILENSFNIIQRFTEFSTGCKVYIRSYFNNSTWTPWTLK